MMGESDSLNCGSILNIFFSCSSRSTRLLMLVSCAADTNKALRHAEDEKRPTPSLSVHISAGSVCYIVLMRTTIIRIKIEPSLFII